LIDHSCRKISVALRPELEHQDNGVTLGDIPNENAFPRSLLGRDASQESILYCCDERFCCDEPYCSRSASHDLLRTRRISTSLSTCFAVERS